MYIIKIEELVGNAFISYLQETDKRTLSLSKINKFSEKVIEYLNINGARACTDINREKTNEFFYHYSNWFKQVENGNNSFIILNSNVTLYELIEEFSGYLSLDVLLALRNPRNTKILLNKS